MESMKYFDCRRRSSGLLHICNLYTASRGCTDWLELLHDTACLLKHYAWIFKTLPSIKIGFEMGTSYWNFGVCESKTPTWLWRRHNSLSGTSFSCLALHVSAFCCFIPHSDWQMACHAWEWICGGVGVMICQLGEWEREVDRFVARIHIA